MKRVYRNSHQTRLSLNTHPPLQFCCILDVLAVICAFACIAVCLTNFWVINPNPRLQTPTRPDSQHTPNIVPRATHLKREIVYRLQTPTRPDSQHTPSNIVLLHPGRASCHLRLRLHHRVPHHPQLLGHHGPALAGAALWRRYRPGRYRYVAVLPPFLNWKQFLLYLVADLSPL